MQGATRYHAQYAVPTAAVLLLTLVTVFIPTAVAHAQDDISSAAAKTYTLTADDEDNNETHTSAGFPSSGDIAGSNGDTLESNFAGGHHGSGGIEDEDRHALRITSGGTGQYAAHDFTLPPAPVHATSTASWQSTTAAAASSPTSSECARRHGQPVLQTQQVIGKSATETPWDETRPTAAHTRLPAIDGKVTKGHRANR